MNKENSIEIFNKSFPSSKKIRKQIIDSVVNIIIEQKLNLVLNKHELYLIIDESLTNAMEHGNQWNPDKNVNISVMMSQNCIIIRIRYEGQGFASKNIPDKITNVKNLKPRGRGIYIIKQFCEPKWNETGNQIELQIDVKK